ncbi:MAG: class I SAM-dependent methyltransferase [Geobacter sp.]|nr:MAG: class I SAM-dependent methyltransferase [Geobacter sp.]
MNLIERSHCVITGKKDLLPLYTFHDFPVFMGCSDEAPEHDLKADMSWAISRETGLIQLDRVLPLDVLYREAHGAGCVGTLWDKHHTMFAEFLHKLAPSSVFEIGGAHGILSLKYQRYADIPWTILEPNPTPVDGCKAEFVKGFFDGGFRSEKTCHTVVHSHLFEHVYEPDRFMQDLSGFIAEGGQLAFSLPNMQVMLERRYTNCINFEHTVFLSEPYIEFLLAKHGFRLLAKELFMEDHSIFYAAVRDPLVRPLELPEGLFEKNMRLYLEYVAYHAKLIGELNATIRETNLPVYLFGAHVFAQYLVAFGLDTGRIICLLDNDPNKQGKRLYGTSFRIASPKALREVSHPLVILKAGVYNDEVRQDILQNINPEARFLE